MNIRWKIDEIHVVIKQIKKRSRASDCEGEVDVNKPDLINIYIGDRVRWTPRSLVVFIHELIHCATLSGKDLRFNEPGIIEDWIYDELATDLLAQHVLKRAGVKYKPDTVSSIDYAFVEVARKLVRSRQFKGERMRFVKDIERKLRSYVKTTGKNFFSFRKMLQSA